jgi:hypothetical protein
VTGVKTVSEMAQVDLPIGDGVPISETGDDLEYLEIGEDLLDLDDLLLDNLLGLEDLLLDDVLTSGPGDDSSSLSLHDALLELPHLEDLLTVLSVPDLFNF